MSLSFLSDSMTGTPLEILLGLLLGVGLSASCGFRVFVPPLIMSAAALHFGIPLPEGIQWIGGETVFFILLTASLLEAGAYYVPWLDHALDTIAAPAATVAGTLITASFLGGHLEPWQQWTLAFIAGGGSAVGIQALTSTSRLASFATTAGLGNPFIATMENILAVTFSMASVFFPIIGAILGLSAITVIIFALVKLNHWFSGRRKSDKAN